MHYVGTSFDRILQYTRMNQRSAHYTIEVFKKIVLLKHKSSKVAEFDNIVKTVSYL